MALPSFLILFFEIRVLGYSLSLAGTLFLPGVEVPGE
jgi:hypothetical protein